MSFQEIIEEVKKLSNRNLIDLGIYIDEEIKIRFKEFKEDRWQGE